MGRTPTGSIDQLRDGRWRLRATVAGVRTTLATYTTRTDAEAARPHVLAELERRRASTARESLTIATWGERWLDAREVSRTIRDVTSDRRPAGGRRRLARQLRIESFRALANNRPGRACCGYPHRLDCLESGTQRPAPPPRRPP